MRIKIFGISADYHDSAAALVVDGNTLEAQWEIDFPHSLGLLYSAFTYYTGFRVNSGEYKLMGLAPYGEPNYVNLILDKLLDVKADGSFRLDMSYFNYATGLTMTNRKFDDLFGGPARKAESDITQREMDIARSIQVVTEDVVYLYAFLVETFGLRLVLLRPCDGEEFLLKSKIITCHQWR